MCVVGGCGWGCVCGVWCCLRRRSLEAALQIICRACFAFSFLPHVQSRALFCSQQLNHTFITTNTKTAPPSSIATSARAKCRNRVDLSCLVLSYFDAPTPSQPPGPPPPPPDCVCLLLLLYLVALVARAPSLQQQQQQQQRGLSSSPFPSTRPTWVSHRRRPFRAHPRGSLEG